MHLNGTILPPAAAGCWLGVFAEGNVENETRRERVVFYFNSRSQTAAVVAPHLKRNQLVLNGKLRFYAQIARVSEEQGMIRMNISTVSAG